MKNRLEVGKLFSKFSDVLVANKVRGERLVSVSWSSQVEVDVELDLERPGCSLCSEKQQLLQRRV